MSIEHYEKDKAKEFTQKAVAIEDSIREYMENRDAIKAVVTLGNTYELIAEFYTFSESPHETVKILDEGFGEQLKKVISLFKASGIMEDCQNMLKPENKDETERVLGIIGYPPKIFPKLLHRTEAAIMAAEIFVAGSKAAK